jgi:oligopeptide transport system ATP-binding protein
MSLLSVVDLATSFRTREGVVRAVDGISFEVGPAETLGLVGESGCGKSVTALSIMRLLQQPPAEIRGRVLLDGVDLIAASDAELRRIRGGTITMVFQDPMTSLNPVLTIGRQISELLELHLGMSKSAGYARAAELLDAVGIPGAKARLNDYPHQFSGGMRQRVMIAMAIACRPKLILADEITTALDVTTQAQVLTLLAALAKETGTSCLLITHDLGIVAGMTQRVHVMYAGRIVEKASTTDLFEHPQMPYTWGLLRSIPRMGEERHRRLYSIEGMPPSLIDPAPGCRFEPRCAYRRPICREAEPELRPTVAGTDHEARCWGIQDVPEGGWLRGVDWRSDRGDPTILRRIEDEMAAPAGAPDAAESGPDGVPAPPGPEAVG